MGGIVSSFIEWWLVVAGHGVWEVEFCCGLSFCLPPMSRGLLSFVCEVVIGDMLLLCVAIWRGVSWVDVSGLCLGDNKRLVLVGDTGAYC